MSNVHSKLMQARIKLQGMQLKKSGKNKFAGFEYFELSDFLPAVQQIFHDVGLCGIVSYTNELATLTIVDVENNSQIQITSPMAEANLKGVHPIQNMGAVESYSRRYLWITALEIVEHDILDATTGSPVSGRAVKGVEKVITPAGGIGDDLPDEEKEFLRELAQSVTDLCSAGKAQDARAMVLSNKLESDQMTFMSRQLDATTRRLLKEAKEAN